MTPIEKYLARVAEEKKLGADSEQNLRPHFHALLKHYAEAESLSLEFEPRIRGELFMTIPDAKLRRQGVPVGYLEDKDAKDNLNVEIDKKLNQRGYPRENILFENTLSAVLYQRGKRVLECAMDDAEALHHMLLSFVRFQTEEQAGFFKARETLKQIVPALADELRSDLAAEGKSNPDFRAKLDDFLSLAQETINKNLNHGDMIELVIQHLLTEDIFIIFFDEADFHKDNAVSRTVDALMNTLKGRKKDIRGKIAPYLAALRAHIHTMGKEDKKDILKIFYEDFYTALNAKKADVQGVVYTPLAVVRFMIDAAQHLLYKYFDKNLSSPGVTILDPCTGTGIFLTELIERMDAKRLPDKFKGELFANEIDILPYYIANLNIEYAYRERTGSYEEFPNICLIDTLEFQAEGVSNQLFGIANINDENLERAKRQYATEISVVIGNPPYNSNQKSENDNNQNKSYASVDERIKNTYIKESTAQKTKQFDMYKRFIRWASDRIHEKGMVCFITNNSYIDARQDDGFRKCLQKEFDYAYIYDLRGNARKNDKAEGQSVFNIMVGTAIMFLIKKDNVKDKKAKIFYKSVAEGASRFDKLFALQSQRFEDIENEFEQILPSERGQWLNFGAEDFAEHPALISKEVKNKGLGDERAIFELFSLGACTNRDAWAYDFNPKQLESKIKKIVSVYNQEFPKWKGTDYQDFAMRRDLDYSIQWTRGLLQQMQGHRGLGYEPSMVRPCLYRPFVKSNMYFERPICHEPYQNPKLFPTGKEGENIAIAFLMPEKQLSFSCLAVSTLTNLHLNGRGTFVAPLYRYTAEGEKLLNITGWGMELFRDKYGAEITAEGKDARSAPIRGRGGTAVGAGGTITAEQVFAYCYGVLSSPAYQKKYADNLKTDYPRIPLYPNFAEYCRLGQELINLHAGYENTGAAEGLTIIRDDAYLPEGITRPNKNGVTHPMKIKDMDVRSAAGTGCAGAAKGGGSGFVTLHLDARNRIEGIPAEAFNYKIGSRSALEWVVEYHKFKKLNPAEKHHQTLIEEGLDTYDWASIRAALFDLVPRIVAVSLKTVKILGELERMGDG